MKLHHDAAPKIGAESPFVKIYFTFCKDVTIIQARYAHIENLDCLAHSGNRVLWFIVNQSTRLLEWTRQSKFSMCAYRGWIMVTSLHFYTFPVHFSRNPFFGLFHWIRPKTTWETHPTGFPGLKRWILACLKIFSEKSWIFRQKRNFFFIYTFCPETSWKSFQT